MISGQMRGLEKTAPDGAHKHTHVDSKTNSAQWGRVGENQDNIPGYIEEGELEEEAIEEGQLGCLR